MNFRHTTITKDKDNLITFGFVSTVSSVMLVLKNEQS